MSADAIVLAALSLRGLSYGDPATRPEFVRRLAPFDPPAVADNLCGHQSCCTTAACAMLLIAEVDGMVRGMPGRPIVCDPLRSPRAGHYDSPAYLETLGQQHGLLRRPKAGELPALLAGCLLLIATGNNVHGLVVTGDIDADGWFLCVEGGKLDPLSTNTGAEACTAISKEHRRQVRQVGGVWRCYAEDGSDGRPVAWWYQAGLLPCVQG